MEYIFWHYVKHEQHCLDWTDTAICFTGEYVGIAVGIVGALVSAILVYGAHARNHTAILIWMIFAILQCIGAVSAGIYFTILVFGANKKLMGDELIISIVLIIYIVVVILFQIWTIIVAMKARKEIQQDQRKISPRPNDGQQIGNKVTTIGVWLIE